MSEITRVLQSIDAGDSQAAERLLPLVYDELRKLARDRIAHEKPGHTLQATALVHEAYLRLVATDKPKWNSAGHFFGAAAVAMRRILVEQARRRATLKRGGEFSRIELDAQLLGPERDDKMLLLDAALDRLEAESPIKAKLVQLRFFTGLTISEAAESLRISTATAERYWAYARARLLREMTKMD